MAKVVWKGKRNFVAVLLILILAMTGCGQQTDLQQGEEVEETTEILEVEETETETETETENASVFMKFYNEEGEDNGEIYEIILSQDVEEALEKRCVLQVDIVEYNKLMFAESEYEFCDIQDPFTGDYYMGKCGLNMVGERQILSDLSPMIGRFVLLNFWDSSYKYCYAVLKIN